MALGGLLLGASALASDPAPSVTVLLPEPAFMHSSPSYVIKDSTRTVLVPVRVKGDEVVPMTKSQTKRFGGAKLVRGTAQAGSEILQKIEPRIHRDAKDVIEFVEIVSASPLTASVVFAPELRSRFADLLGPDFLVVIPSRYRVYLFPRQATSVEDYAPMIFAAYDATPYPVSPEVFEITNEGLRGFGIFERP